MNRKKGILGLTVLFLFTGTAFAPIGMAEESDYEEDRRECEEEYAEARAEAEADAQGEVRYGTDNRSEEKDREKQAEAEAEAKADYEECMAKAESDANEEQEKELEEAQKEAEEREEEYEDDLPSSYEGRHVDFELTRNGIANYSVGGAEIFSSVGLEGVAGWKEFEQHGASVKIEGRQAEAKISDTHTGLLRFEADDDHDYIYLQLADGVSVRDGTSNDSSSIKHHRLMLAGDGFTAVLFTEAGFRLTDRGIVAPDEIRFSMLRTDALDKRLTDTAIDAISDGRIAVVVEVGREKDYREAEYGEVNVTVEPTERGLRATVESHGEGKTVVFTLEHGALGDIENLQVIFDGEIIGHADDVEDVLDISDGSAEYIVLVGAEATQVMVQVPHFSVHTIELSGAAVGGGSTIVSSVAVVAGGALAAIFVASTLIARRRH